MPTNHSRVRRGNTDLTRANQVRLRRYAEAAAEDPRKLAKAVRTVLAAHDKGLLEGDRIDDLRDYENEAAA